jgi:hypothetical protein
MYSPATLRKTEYRLASLLSGVVLAHPVILLGCILRAKAILGHWPDLLADHSPSSVLGPFFYVYAASYVLLYPSLFLWAGAVVLASIQYRTCFNKASWAAVLAAVGLYLALSYLPGSSFEWIFD